MITIKDDPAKGEVAVCSVHGVLSHDDLYVYPNNPHKPSKNAGRAECQQCRRARNKRRNENRSLRQSLSAPSQY